MSASISPTRWPSRASAAARFAETVDFPTPPLPLEIANTLPSPGISFGVGGAGGAGDGRPAGRPEGRSVPSAESTTFIFTAVTPPTASTALRAWRASDPGSSGVSTNVKLTSPLASTAMSFTMPAVTISRPWRGFVISPKARSTPALIPGSLTMTGLPSPPSPVTKEGSCSTENLFFDFRHRAVDRCARSTMVPAAAELVRQRGDVHLAHRPEGDFDAAVRDMPEEERHANTGNRARELDDAVEIIRRDGVPAQRVGWHAHPREPHLRFDDQRLQDLGEQPHAAFGCAGVDRRVDGLRIHALLEQRGGNPQRARGRIGKPESACVSQQSDVQRLRALRRQRPAGDVREIEHELGRCRRLGSNEARTCRQFEGTDMMIDANERRLALVDDGRESPEARNVPDVERGHDVGTLDLFDRAIARVGAFRDEEAESLGNASRVRDRDGDASGAEHMPQANLAADPVAVGIDMRRQHDVPGARERRGHVARRLRTMRWNGNAVRIHFGEDNRLVPGARQHQTLDLAPLVRFAAGAVSACCSPGRRGARRSALPPGEV